MKQTLKYHSFSIPSKLRCDIRLALDDTRSAEYNGTFEGNIVNNLSLYPMISLSIIRPVELDEEGKRIRGPWNPNDSLPMTKYSLPILISEIIGIQQDMKIPELYTYHGKRLELNEQVAAKIRRVFMIGTTTLELSAVVIEQENDNRVEGIKIKFNNEQSSVFLTLNELTSLSYNLNNINLDIIAFMMYNKFVKSGMKEYSTNTNSYQSNTTVDILPKE